MAKISQASRPKTDAPTATGSRAPEAGPVAGGTHGSAAYAAAFSCSRAPRAADLGEQLNAFLTTRVMAWRSMNHPNRKDHT